MTSLMSETSGDCSTMSSRVAIPLILGLLVSACQNDKLEQGAPQLIVEAQPEPRQTRLQEPEGLDLGDIPLSSITVATFRLENRSTYALSNLQANVISLTGGELTVTTIPTNLEGGEVSELGLWVKVPREESFEAVLELTSNAPIPTRVILRGEGVFIGEPKLQVSWDTATVHPTTDECQTNNGTIACTTSLLQFTSTPAGRTTTQRVTIENRPEPGTCIPPENPDGSQSCDPVCVLTISPDPSADDIGLGFRSGQQFSMVGSAPLPLLLAPTSDACPDIPGIVRGPVELLLQFQGSDIEGTFEDAWLLESDAPNVQLLEVPVAVDVREAPISIVNARECDLETTSQCNVDEEYEPLEIVFLDGTESFDPTGLTLVDYRWEFIAVPDGLDPDLLEPMGETTPIFGFTAPLAGTYKIGLTVTNEIGVESLVTESSVLTVEVVPSSQLHIQLVWDSATTDHDLHLVYASPIPATEGSAYHANWDCYWKSCKTNCDQFSVRPCDNPTQWFPDYPAFEGPNPRLDIDDTFGLGPENINIDSPADGLYKVYVHYYAIGSAEDSVRSYATLRIYGNGLLRAEYQRALEKNQLWSIAELDWRVDTGLSVSPIPSDDATEIGTIQDVSFLPSDGLGIRETN